MQAAVPSLRIRTLLASDAGSWQIAFNMSGIAAGNFFQLYGIDPELDPQVRVYALSAGRMPGTDKYEVVIPEKTAREKDLQIGQDLVFLTPEGLGRLEIVGLLAGEGVACSMMARSGFAPMGVVQDLFGRGGEYDEIALQIDQPIAESPGALEALKDALSRRLGEDSQVAYPASRGQLISQMLATYQMGLTFFSLIAIFVGAFLIYNTFSMTVVERTREIGMLRAVGMSRRQVLGMVLAEAGLLSMVGSVIGLAAGYWLALGLIRLIGRSGDGRTGGFFSLTWPGLLQSLAVGVGVTLVAALLPALQAARISPLEALRARGRSTSRPSPALGLVGDFADAGRVAGLLSLPLAERACSSSAVTSHSICFFLGATLTVGDGGRPAGAPDPPAGDAGCMAAKARSARRTCAGRSAARR